MNKDIQKLHQALITSGDEQAATMVAERTSEVTVYPAPFLKHYRIYRVLYYSPYKPILLYLGFAPEKPEAAIYSLAGNPPAYHQMARADEVDLSTPDLAISYVTVFLEVTRNMYELVYQVTSVDQIRFLRKLSHEQLQAKEALTEKYRSALTPPPGVVTEEGYMVVAHVVRQQELERHTFKVRRNGDMESQITVIEQAMPVVIGI
jgi:hypothetical protein